MEGRLSFPFFLGGGEGGPVSTFLSSCGEQASQNTNDEKKRYSNTTG